MNILPTLKGVAKQFAAVLADFEPGGIASLTVVQVPSP